MTNLWGGGKVLTPGGRRGGWDRVNLVHTSQGACPGTRDVPHLNSALLDIPSLAEPIDSSLVVDGDQGSGRVDVVVRTSHVIALPALLMVNVSLAVLIGHLVAKVVLGRPIVGLLNSLAWDLGP